MLTGPEIARILGGEWRGQSGMCPCPICQPERRNDQRALSVSFRAGRLLMLCHKSGCTYPEIMKAAGIAPDPSEKTAEARQRDEAAREAERRAQAQRAATAAQRATEVMRQARVVRGHPYMVRKGLARAPVSCLPLGWLSSIIRRPKIYADLGEAEPIMCIGLYDVSTPGDWASVTLKSLQMIAPDGTKCFLYGGSTKGVAAILSRRPAEAFGPESVRFVCEGYATGLSALHAAHHEKLDISILCAMTAGNIEVVARSARCHGVIADHDTSDTGSRAAMRTRLPWVMPPETDQDFNDLWRADPMAARKMISSLHNRIHEEETK